MCLIAVKPKGKKNIPALYLRNGEENNQDGIGVCWLKNGKQMVSIKKDFKNVEELIVWQAENIKKDDILVVHFRWATSGLTDEGNRHPFPITRNKPLMRKTNLMCSYAVAHNGVLSAYSGHKKFSDTQKFVMDILADPTIKENLKNPAIRKLISDYIGTDKLAIITKNGELVMIGEFQEDGGHYYSNHGYKYGSNIRYSKYYRDSVDYSDFGQGGWAQPSGTRNVPLPSSQRPVEGVPTTLSGKPFKEQCDGCEKDTYCLEVEILDKVYNLCKKCRKKARKSKLVLPEVQEFIPCDYCDEEYTEGELVKIYQDYVVCEKCLNEHRSEFGLEEEEPVGGAAMCDPCRGGSTSSSGINIATSGADAVIDGRHDIGGSE